MGWRAVSLTMVMWRHFYSSQFCEKDLGYVGDAPALGAGSFQLLSVLA